MSNKWDLTQIYPSFTDSSFLNDIENLKNVITEFNVLATSIQDRQATIGLEKYIELLSTFSTLTSRLGSYISLTISADTTNEVALKYSDIIEGILTKVVEPITLIENWIAQIKELDSCLENSALLKEHTFFIKEIVTLEKYSLPASEENIMANMKNTGSNAWSKLKDQLISAHTITIDNQALPLTVVLNMAYDEDKEVRKKAYEAEISSYKKIEQGVAACLNSIKGEVLSECHLRGYASPIDRTLLASRMSKKTLDVMLEAMQEALPAFREYFKIKAKHLGYSTGLPWYELYAPVVNAKMSFDFTSGSQFVVNHFGSFSKHLADFASEAITKNWIDVYPRAGKVGGAFCSNLHFIKQSRFLLNYGDSFNDVVTLAHELGHGFHGECLKEQPVLNADYPMPIAETASTFCETIIKKAAIKSAEPNEALAILETEISGCSQVIVDIYSRFLFEKHFFEERQESALSVERIKTLMLEAQKAAYGDGLDQNYLHPYMWTWKPHYYYADSNFYNFPYAFGLLLAKGLYAKYMEEGPSFAEKYEDFLAYTGKASLEDVAMQIGIDLTDIAFWRASLQTILEDIAQFKELMHYEN